MAALLCLGAQAGHAQDATRIVAATVYPDSASVDRELRVPGGTRHVTIACVPAAVDVSTLQVDGDAEARMGDVRATELPASRVQECEPPVALARRNELALQRATLESQRDANDLAFTFLKQWSNGEHADTPDVASAPGRAGAAAGVARPGATASELRRSALELLSDQARIKRDLDALERAEAKLADDAPAARGKDGWRTVRFDVRTPAPASLRVRYGVANTYWRPTYRASVDIARASVRIDRQADVVQASGEDWSDVRVKLSTRQSKRPSEAAPPTPWWLDLVAAVASMAGFGETAMPIAAAPARRAYAPQSVELIAGSVKRLDVVPPPWGVDVARGDYATEFDIAQPVSLASDGETHTLAIATQSLPVTLLRRTTPRNDRAVYLLAQAERPAGVWPAGPLQSYQDGTLVGRSAVATRRRRQAGGGAGPGRPDACRRRIARRLHAGQGLVRRQRGALVDGDLRHRQPAAGRRDGGDAGRGAGVAQRGDHRDAQVRSAADDDGLEQGDRRRRMDAERGGAGHAPGERVAHGDGAQERRHREPAVTRS